MFTLNKFLFTELIVRETPFIATEPFLLIYFINSLGTSKSNLIEPLIDSFFFKTPKQSTWPLTRCPPIWSPNNKDFSMFIFFLFPRARRRYRQSLFW